VWDRYDLIDRILVNELLDMGFYNSRFRIRMRLL